MSSAQAAALALPPAGSLVSMATSPPLRYAVTIEWSAEAPFVQRRLAQEAARAELAQAVRRHQALEAQLRGPTYRADSPAWRTLFVSSITPTVDGEEWMLEAFPALALFGLATELGDLVWPEVLPARQASWAPRRLARRGFDPVYVGPAGGEYELWHRTRLTD